MLSFNHTAVDCGHLFSPANGYVNLAGGTVFGDIAMYSCYTGYRLSGTSNRECLYTGSWSGNAPTCNRKSLELQSIMHVGVLGRLKLCGV